ncbi:permease for cytosine/purines, uracil, thiamine, allantoin-domain-containing protein [Staphylotrichum tortipilum]|uniref:Permease for cytosine/purines, uracil, thiamine, allantoin-domain-containing protein n=1 Tax=Staphylotrichum tortipilum TaxID=2831512 RepID=A0AAN6MMB8_9PEZI|nr:permease for cytosine/purines, uracil, thiamine, allantoin-domain-containing protein [Staphylotrichum longicolle]
MAAETRADEKLPPGSDPERGADTVEVVPARRWARTRDFLHKAATFGRVEVRGITPIPVKERTVERTVNIFTLWWSMNTNILGITFGMLAPVYGLNLRDSALIILFFTLLTTLLPAYLCTLGPKIGMRQMLQARYSFGRYLVSIPVVLNLATLIGFCVIMAVIGGQCLSAVAGGNLSVSVGIVITAILTLGISFCGFTVLHTYERYAWIPAIISIIVAVGTGGKELHKQVVYDAPPSAQSVLSYGMIVASYMVPWACLSSDFTTYLKPDTSSTKIFAYSYLGLATPTILLMTLGSAIGNAIPNVPTWQAAYDETLVGGVMAAMLAPAGGFGKFLVVLLSFSLLGNLAATSYSVTLNLQLLLPFLVKVPRYLFSIVFVAIVIPVAIRAAGDFFVNLENVVALIGYWSSAFLAIVLTEHFWFRRADPASYDPEAWNDAKRLPWGAAALTAGVLSFGLVVPSMAQVWWTGPIAEKTGDIGFELAFVASGVFYLPLRMLEKKWAGR